MGVNRSYHAYLVGKSKDSFTGERKSYDFKLIVTSIESGLTIEKTFIHKAMDEDLHYSCPHYRNLDTILRDGKIEKEIVELLSLFPIEYHKFSQKDKSRIALNFFYNLAKYDNVTKIGKTNVNQQTLTKLVEYGKEHGNIIGIIPHDMNVVGIKGILEERYNRR